MPMSILAISAISPAQACISGCDDGGSGDAAATAMLASDAAIARFGEGDPVGPRLKAHGVQKEFWTEAAVFTSKDD